MALRLRVQGSDELKAVAAALRGAPRKLKKELSVAFHDAGVEAVYRVKGNALSMSIKGLPKPGAKRRFRERRAGTNLRSDIAAAVGLDLNVSGDDPQVTFLLDPRNLGRRANIPWHMESSGSKWRHPIMGNREAWAANVGQPFFYDELRSDVAIFSDKCDEAIERVVAQIESE